MPFERGDSLHVYDNVVISMIWIVLSALKNVSHYPHNDALQPPPSSNCFQTTKHAPSDIHLYMNEIKISN